MDPQIIYHIRASLLQWESGVSSIRHFRFIAPPNWFSSPEDAWQKLEETVEWIQNLEGHKKRDAIYQWHRCNYKSLFLQECPEYDLIYMIKYHPYFEKETEFKFDLFAHINHTLNKNSTLSQIV